MSCRLIQNLLLLGLVLAGSAQAAEGLTLSDALTKALQQNPTLQAAGQQAEAARGRQQQAGVLPNPEVGMLLEDFSGDTGVSAGDATTTMELSQRLELGGKRSSRVAIARTDTGEAELAAQVRRLEVVRDTRIAFHTLQVAQERLRLAREAEALARQVHQAVQARIEAGKVSPIEGARTQVALNAAERRARLAERETAQARTRLSVLWGGEPVPGDIVSLTPLPATLTPPPEDTSRSPELSRLSLEVERARAGVRAARAGTVPDITLRIGTKREAVTEDQSLLAGVSLPLPLFNRNQGERRAAHAELNAAEATLAAEKLQVEAEITSQRQQLEAAHAEARALQEGVLGTAEQAFAATREGYRAGKFGLLELLDAQRALIDTRNAYLDSLLSYFQSQAALDRLLGRDVTVSGDAP